MGATGLLLWGTASSSTLERTHLASVASQTAPGTFSPLRGELPPGFDQFSGFHNHNTPVDPDTWNTRGQWDPERLRTFFYGDRRRSIFHSYHARTNEWLHNSLDDRIEGAHHQYGSVGLDVANGYFYRASGRALHRYHIDEDSWEVANDNHPGRDTSPMAFHEGLDKLLLLHRGRLHQLSQDQWTAYKSLDHQEKHANMIYNRARDELLIVGGRNTERKLSIVAQDGTVHRMDDMPFRWRAQHHVLSYDPGSGNYLVLHRKSTELWEYHPGRDQWHLARNWRNDNPADWTFGRHYGHTLIPIDGLGVILWIHRSGPMVYRHEPAVDDASPEEPLAASQTEQDATTPQEEEPTERAPSTSRDESTVTDQPRGQVTPPDMPQRAEVPADLLDTPLGQLARRLAPGQFQTLEDTAPPEGFRGMREYFQARTPDGRRGPIDAWTDSGHWDGRRQRTFFQGIEGSDRFLSFNADENRWESLAGPESPAPPSSTGYTYGQTALDAKRGHYYRLSGGLLLQYDIDAGEWTQRDVAPADGPTPIEWHQGIDMLVNASNGLFHGYDGTDWQELGEAGVSGEYSTAQYNPKHDELLVLGGTESERQGALLDREGKIRPAPELPFDFKLSLDNLTYDPQSGHFLVLRWDARELWELDPDAGRWQQARRWSSDHWPFHEFGTVVPIPIDELGVIFWQYEHGPRIYRHRTAADTQVAQASHRASNAETPQSDRGSGESGLPSAGRLPSGAEGAPERPEPAPGDPDAQPHDALAEIGAGMTPGEWRYVETTNTPDFQVSFCPLDDPDSGSTHALGWTGNFAYDPDSQSFWAIGMRGGSEKRLFMLNRDLEWFETRIPLDECRTDRRPFNRLSLVDGYLYWPSSVSGNGRASIGQLKRAPIEPYLAGKTDVAWERVSDGFGINNMNATGDFSVTWFPDLGGWVFVGRNSGSSTPEPYSQEGHTEEGEQLGKYWYARAMFLRPPSQEWIQFDRVYSGQYQGHLLYNPVKRQVLVAPGREFGGSRSGSSPNREWAIIHHDGGDNRLVRHPDDGPTPWVEKLDRPVGDDFELPDYSVRHGTISYDPRNGDYLWWNRAREKIWRSEDGKHWTVYEDFSDMPSDRFPEDRVRFRRGGGLFGATGYVQMNAIPGTDLLLFVDPDRGLILHRMKVD